MEPRQPKAETPLVRKLGRHVLRKHARPFAYAFAGLTLFQLVNSIRKSWASLLADQQPITTILQLSALSLPYIVALTLPMAVLVAALYASMRLAADPEIDVNLPHGIALTQVAKPVLLAAAGLALLMVLWNDQVVPRSNRSLVTLAIAIGLRDPAGLPAGRTMTISELREAALVARGEASRAIGESAWVVGMPARRRAAMLEVEIQKKYALAAACLVFAFFGASVGFWIRRGIISAIAVGFVVYWFYYTCLIAGEALADRLMVSPLVGMWSGNVILGTLGLLAFSRLTRHRPREAPRASGAA